MAAQLGRQLEGRVAGASQGFLPALTGPRIPA
jgi:hypothetical protein